MTFACCCVRLSCQATEQYSVYDLINRENIWTSFVLERPAYLSLVNIDILAYVRFMISLVFLSQHVTDVTECADYLVRVNPVKVPA